MSYLKRVPHMIRIVIKYLSTAFAVYLYFTQRRNQVFYTLLPILGYYILTFLYQILVGALVRI